MKYALIIWNVVLTALVIYLLTLTNPTAPDKIEVQESDSTSLDGILSSTDNPSAKIVFINTDSLFEKYDMYSDLQDELLAEKLRYESRYKKEVQKLEKEYLELREKAPFMTQTQGEAAQSKLVEKQQELVEMERDLSTKFVNKESVMVKQIKASIEEYLQELNAENNYQFVLGKSNLSGILFADDALNITEEAIQGLNKKYANTKSTNSAE